MRRGSLPWLSLPSTRPRSFLMTSSVCFDSASSRPRCTASDLRPCRLSARIVPSVWTAQRPSGLGSTATCGLRAIDASSWLCLRLYNAHAHSHEPDGRVFNRRTAPTVTGVESFWPHSLEERHGRYDARGSCPLAAQVCGAGE